MSPINLNVPLIAIMVIALSSAIFMISIIKILTLSNKSANILLIKWGTNCYADSVLKPAMVSYNKEPDIFFIMVVHNWGKDLEQTLLLHQILIMVLPTLDEVI